MDNFGQEEFLSPHVVHHVDPVVYQCFIHIKHT